MALPFRRKTPFERIEEFLDSERAIILRGDLDALMPMISAREALVAELEGSLEASDEDAIATVERLQVKARRNAGLIKAAIEGIKAANARVAEIEAAHSRLSTYSANGQVENVVKPSSNVIRKA